MFRTPSDNAYRDVATTILSNPELRSAIIDIMEDIGYIIDDTNCILPEESNAPIISIISTKKQILSSSIELLEVALDENASWQERDEAKGDLVSILQEHVQP